MGARRGVEEIVGARAECRADRHCLWRMAGVAAPPGELVLGRVAPASAALLTRRRSLRHEILHGGPKRWRRLNRLLGVASLFL
jgi:fatty acid desaturase